MPPSYIEKGDAVLVNLQTLAQNLALSISQSQDAKITAASTNTINKVKNEVVSDAIKENLGVPDISGLTTDEELAAALSSYVKTADIFKSGYFYTKKDNDNGSYALLWNESDGGGSQYYNKNSDMLSYVGTNDGGPDGIAVQIYSKYKDGTDSNTVKNSGVRINVNPKGAYYTKGTNTSATGGSVDNEIAVKADINALLTRISDLEALVTTLQTALSTAVDINGNPVYTIPQNNNN